MVGQIVGAKAPWFCASVAYPKSAATCAAKVFISKHPSRAFRATDRMPARIAWIFETNKIDQAFLGFPLMDGVPIFRTPPKCSNWIDHDYISHYVLMLVHVADFCCKDSWDFRFPHRSLLEMDHDHIHTLQSPLFGSSNHSRIREKPKAPSLRSCIPETFAKQFFQ